MSSSNDSSAWKRQGWRAGLAALLWALAFAVCAADADIVAKGEELVRAGRYAEAFELLEPLEDRLAGDVKFDYLLARSALETNRASRASFIYERILAVEPNYLGVRLEMGRAYLALGDYARAKLEFETVLRFENLPPGLREQAQVYAKAAEDTLAGKKTVGYGYIEIGFGNDSNVQSATPNSQIIIVNGATLVLDPTQTKRGDNYGSFALGGELVHALTPAFSVYAGADGRGRKYHEIDVADYSTLDGRAGLGYAEGPNFARLGVTAGRYWLDHEKTRDGVGLTGDYRRLVTKQDQVTLNVLGMSYRYLSDDLKSNNFNLYQAALGWVHASADGRTVGGLTLLGGLENATNGRADGDKPFYGARFTLQMSFYEQFGAFALGGVQRGQYRDVNVLFDTKRADTLYDLMVGVTWSFAKGWSLRPQVQYYRNKSNLPLFDYEKTDFSLNLRADF